MFDGIRRGLRARVLRLVDDAVRPRLDARVEQHETWLRSELDEVVARAAEEVRSGDRRSRRNVFEAAEREAVRTSALFAYEHFPTATTFTDKDRTLEHAVAAAPESGMALEFGVYSGHTLEIISRLRGRRDVYGFDSFQGLPEDWRSTFPAATFAVDDIPRVEGAEMVVGWFDDTLHGFLEQHPGDVALLHLDADLYSSAVTVLDLVGPRLRPGSIVVFDEYFNFPGWQQHEHRAWQEYVARTGLRYEVEAYTVDDEQVVMRVLAA